MRVLLTHSAGRLEGLTQALSAHGFTVAHYPLIETEFLPRERVRAAAEALLGADWLLFTSRTAVRAWGALGLPLDGATPKLGAVGKRTADDIEQLGGRVALLAEPASAEGLLRTFSDYVSPPATVGLPCGVQALGTLKSGLSRADFTVRNVDLYRTFTRPFPNVQADLIVLASPSAVAALPAHVYLVHLVTLGPSTAQAVRERGWRTTEARTPTVMGVTEAVLQAARASCVLETP